MSSNFSIENHFKKISIRGRLAFGTFCIEQYIKENQLNNSWLDALVQTLWEFMASKRLDLWEDKIRNLEPLNILDDHPNNSASEYSNLSEADFEELKVLYQTLPSTFVDMIDSVIQIGGGNLYGGTGDYSKWTLDPTMEVYNLAKNILKVMPDVGKFSISSFTESGGWGNHIDRSNFEN